MCRLFWIDCVAARLCHTPTLSVVFWWWSVVWLEQTNRLTSSSSSQMTAFPLSRCSLYILLYISLQAGVTGDDDVGLIKKMNECECGVGTLSHMGLCVSKCQCTSGRFNTQTFMYWLALRLVLPLNYITWKHQVKVLTILM